VREPHPPVRHEIYGRLRTAIQTTALKPGAAISENDIAQQLGVSRTPVRDAFMRLTAEGLVRSVPQIGTFVAKLDLGAIREALFIREALECTALRHCAERLGPPRIAVLRAIARRHAQAVREQNLQEIKRQDEALHRALIELSGFPGAWRIVLQARDMHERVRAISVPMLRGGDRSAQHHRAIVAALAAGDVAAAEATLRAHIQMNGAFAEDIARRMPEYFDAP